MSMKIQYENRNKHQCFEKYMEHYNIEDYVFQDKRKMLFWRCYLTPVKLNQQMVSQDVLEKVPTSRYIHMCWKYENIVKFWQLIFKGKNELTMLNLAECSKIVLLSTFEKEEVN